VGQSGSQVHRGQKNNKRKITFTFVKNDGAQSLTFFWSTEIGLDRSRNCEKKCKHEKKKTERVPGRLVRVS